MPAHINPAEFLLDLVNVDFVRDRAAADNRLQHIQAVWAAISSRTATSKDCRLKSSIGPGMGMAKLSKRSQALIPFTLLHRNFIKSYRDIVVYGIRIAMYIGWYLIQTSYQHCSHALGLAIMMGTIWLRLSTSQEDIQPFINAIVSFASSQAKPNEFLTGKLTTSQFFGSAFMSFMAVAYVPAFLEDRATFVKERANGLYGPTSFMIANFLIGLPYLCMLRAFCRYRLSHYGPSLTLTSLSPYSPHLSSFLLRYLLAL
jgi:hypothetical protein